MRRKRMHGKRRGPFRFMKEDTTLMAAATAAEEANIPHSQAKVYESVAKGHAESRAKIGAAIGSLVYGGISKITEKEEEKENGNGEGEDVFA
jgi:hypothetical protein|tara:strand:- start:243 stop:518 length:276 start_codon:yes stop_codon:yes gene_type:complete